MSRRRWIIFVVVAVPAAIIVGTVVRTAWWYAGFKERLRLAEEHAPVVRRALEADGRFSEVSVESFTGSNGSLLVQAVVPPGTANELKAIVVATSPPVSVRYFVTAPKAATMPARE